MVSRVKIMLFPVFMATAFVLAANAEAKTVFYGSAVEQVRIRYGAPTIFRFDGEVQTVTGSSHFQIEPANKTNPSYRLLSVRPRFTNGVNEVTFFLNNNAVVKTRIVVSPNDPAADTFYEFKAHDSVDSAGAENAPVISEIELLKAMYRDDAVSGYKVSRLSQRFPSKNVNAQVELIRIYRGNPFNGYVFKVRNTSRQRLLEIDVRHVTVGKPNMAILSQSDESTLYPRGKGPQETLVRVVAKNTASSRDVILAMESEAPDSKAKKED